jgi:DNA-directed RNA polymerase subunit RPC12/RpoP
MPRYLICNNPRCRFVLDLQISGKALRRSRVPLSECPECGSGWSTSCPFCAQPLNLAWHDQRPHCAHCSRRFLAERLNSAA